MRLIPFEKWSPKPHLATNIDYYGEEIAVEYKSISARSHVLRTFNWLQKLGHFDNKFAQMGSQELAFELNLK